MARSSEKYSVLSFHEYLTARLRSGTGFPAAKAGLDAVLASFSCPRNPDVEMFLRKRAFEQYERRAGMTYLVISAEAETADLVGYFTLALRPFAVPLSTVSRSQFNRLRCCGLSRVRPADGTGDSSSSSDNDGLYEASAFLIGQLGRNFAAGTEASISGSGLLALALDRIHDVQDLAGGRLVVVEAEDRRPLIDFYMRNGFKRFGSRLTVSDKVESPVALIQMFRLIHVRGGAIAEE